MNLDKQEIICNEFDKIIESLEREISETCKLNKNLKAQLEDMNQDEVLTMAWISAYPKD